MSNALRVQYDDLILAGDQCMTWQGRPFTGVAYETDDSGRLVSEVAFVYGLQRGLTREWFGSGQVRSETEYVQGSKQGRSRTWHENGRLASDAEYQYSIKTAEKTWSQNGALIQDWTSAEDDPQRALIDLLARSVGPAPTDDGD